MKLFSVAVAKQTADRVAEAAKQWRSLTVWKSSKIDQKCVQLDSKSAEGGKKCYRFRFLMWNHNISEWLQIFDCFSGFSLRFKKNNNNKKNGGEKGQNAQIYNGQRAPAFGWTAQSPKRAFQIFSSKFLRFFFVFSVSSGEFYFLTTHFMETTNCYVKELDLFI